MRKTFLLQNAASQGLRGYCQILMSPLSQYFPSPQMTVATFSLTKDAKKRQDSREEARTSLEEMYQMLFNFST